ncbi:MAG: hypothetical protein ACYTGR_12510 [Planctomycetota bacterium]|jgi:hypothetical protein
MSTDTGDFGPLYRTCSSLAAACVLVIVGCSDTARDLRATGPTSLGSLEPMLVLQAEPPPLTDSQRGQLAIFKTIVLNPSPDIPAETRRGAVEELLTMGARDAVDVIAEGLRSGDATILVPIADVLADQSRQVPGLLGSTIDALRTAPPAARDNLAAVITRYGSAGLNATAVVALDKTLAPAERLGPIQALGRFHTRDAAVRLMPLLDEVREEPAEIRSATCLALQQVTGQDFGLDVDRWREWWTDAQTLNQQEWLAEQVERLSTQLLAMDERLHSEQQRARDVERRLSGAYRDLFPALPYDQQISRLPVLLEDDLAAVRDFAIGRIDRLLRDTVDIPAALQAQLATRLDDSDPRLRLKAAELLDELTYPGLANGVADRLYAEPDPAVAIGYLAILTKSPRLEALPPIRARLGTPSHVDPATKALWALALDQPLGDADLAATRSAVRSAMATDPAPNPASIAGLTRLLVLLGTDDDIAALTAHLDGDDVAMRCAVADGLAHRGAAQPLIDRAADEVLYPYVLFALRSGPHDPESIQTLIRLVAPAAHREAWRDTVLAMIESLAVEDLLTVDDLLQAMEKPELALREGVLSRAVATNDGGLEPIQRQQVLLRLVPVLFDMDRAADGLALLDEPDGVDRPAALQLLHLQAALRSGAFERAAELAPGPVDWIEALADLSDDSRAVWALRDEIDSRFPDIADESARTRLEELTATLPPRPADGASAAAGDGSDAGSQR